MERVTSEELARLELLLIGILFTLGKGEIFQFGIELNCFTSERELEDFFAEKISFHDTG